MRRIVLRMITGLVAVLFLVSMLVPFLVVESNSTIPEWAREGLKFWSYKDWYGVVWWNLPNYFSGRIQSTWIDYWRNDIGLGFGTVWEGVMIIMLLLQLLTLASAAAAIFPRRLIPRCLLYAGVYNMGTVVCMTALALRITQSSSFLELSSGFWLASSSAALFLLIFCIVEKQITKRSVHAFLVSQDLKTLILRTLVAFACVFFIGSIVFPFFSSSESISGSQAWASKAVFWSFKEDDWLLHLNPPNFVIFEQWFGRYLLATRQFLGVGVTIQAKMLILASQILTVIFAVFVLLFRRFSSLCLLLATVFSWISVLGMRNFAQEFTDHQGLTSNFEIGFWLAIASSILFLATFFVSLSGFKRKSPGGE